MKKKLLVLALATLVAFPTLTGCDWFNKPDDQGGSGSGGGTTPVVDTTKTYRMGPSDIPTAWNIHTYQSNSATYVLDYTTDALYTFDYNEDKTGYKIVPSMAAAAPVDVTASYVGQFGITAEDVTEGGKVYAIELKDNLKFDNGDVITADTFVESMKLLLNPEASNFRADNVYQSGNLKIVGAEAYAKQGQYGTTEFVSKNYGASEYVDPANFTTAQDGTLQTVKDGYTWDVVLNIKSGGNWGNESLLTLAKAGILGDDPRTYSQDTSRVKYASADESIVVWRNKDAEQDETYKWFDAEANGNEVTSHITDDDKGYYYDGTLIAWANCPNPNSSYGKLLGWADEKGLIKLNAEKLLFLQNAIAKCHGKADVAAYAADLQFGDYAYQEFEEMAFLGRNYEEAPWSGVGFIKDDQNRLVVVLKEAMEDNFYLRYALCTDFFLVNPTLYKQCESTSQGVYTNSYGTSVSTYTGFGPYKLTKYTADSEILLEKNKTWHGYSAGEYVEGTYQFDRVQYKKVSSEAVRLEMFLKGQLDSYGLQADDMSTYLGSKYTYFNDSESTWYLAMNPDVATYTTNQATATCGLEGKTDYAVIKTPMAIQEFRQAMSYSIDRTAFNQTLSPLSGVAKALLSSMIIADPETGLSYRTTDAAKDAILSFWGLSESWGEGKEFETRDEAIDSITGYDPTGATTLFETAYTKAVQAGYITTDMVQSGKWVVQICIGIPVTAKYYNDGADLLKTLWTDAVKGTSFEGHVEVIQSSELGSTQFGTYLRNGSVDVLFGVGYGGSMFDPYSMMDCFTGSLQYDPFTNKDNINLDIKVGDKTLRASLYEWVSECLLGTEITATVVDADGNVTAETQKIKCGTSGDQELRVAILAKCEEAIMNLSNIFPLQTDASASLRCIRVQYATEEYILGVGRGGLKYNKCLMTDAEFAAYVEKLPGKVIDYSVSD